MKVALIEKRKKLGGFSFSINIAKFEAFLLVFKLTKMPLFLKSEEGGYEFQQLVIPIFYLFCKNNPKKIKYLK